MNTEKYQSKKALAKLFGIDVATLDRRIAHLDPHHRDGRSIFYETAVVARVLSKYNDKKSRKSAETKAYESARARRMSVLADIAAEKVAAVRAETITPEDVAEVFDAHLDEIRTRLRRVPDDALPALEEALKRPNNRRAVRVIVAAAIDAALEEAQLPGHATMTKAELYALLCARRREKLYPHLRLFTIPIKPSGKLSVDVRLSSEEARAFDQGTLTQKRAREIQSSLRERWERR